MCVHRPAHGGEGAGAVGSTLLWIPHTYELIVAHHQGGSVYACHACVLFDQVKEADIIYTDSVLGKTSNFGKQNIPDTCHNYARVCSILFLVLY